MPNGLDGKGWRSLETLSHLLYVSRCKAAELISNPIEKMRCFMRTSTHTHGSIANLTEAYFWLKFGFLKANPSRRHASFQATGPTGRLIKEIKKHSFFLKPGEKKRLKSKLAQKFKRKKARRLPADTDSKGPRSHQS